MKNLIRLNPVILVFLGVICFSSCEKKNTNDPGKGKVEFSLNLSTKTDHLKSSSIIDSGVISYQLLVSVEDINGNPVLSDSLIPLYIFGTGYVSEDVELKAGEFRLTKFMVIDPAGKVMYASPITGSPMAYLINKPLPLSFKIFADKVTGILPEVLAVGDQSPDQFGYANFGMQIIKPLIFWTICIIDDSLTLSPTQITQANLTIYANNCDWHYTFKLETAVNHLAIRSGSEIYTFILEKEGYIPQKMQFSAKDLLATSKEYPLILKILRNSTYWSEDFEAYNAGTFPGTWIPDGNATKISNILPDSVIITLPPRDGKSINDINSSISNYIDSSISYEGNKSLKLYGMIGGCWAAIAFHPMNAKPPYAIEFAVRNGNEILSGCNPDRAYVGLNKGTSWTNLSQRPFIKFGGDGKVYGGGGTQLSLYNNNTWYLVRIKYEIVSTTEIKLSYWINNNYCGSESFSAISEENLLNNLEIQVLEGSAWYDNIRIIKY